MSSRVCSTYLFHNHGNKYLSQHSHKLTLVIFNTSCKPENRNQTYFRLLEPSDDVKKLKERKDLLRTAKKHIKDLEKKMSDQDKVHRSEVLKHSEMALEQYLRHVVEARLPRTAESLESGVKNYHDHDLLDNLEEEIFQAAIENASTLDNYDYYFAFLKLMSPRRIRYEEKKALGILFEAVRKDDRESLGEKLQWCTSESCFLEVVKTNFESHEAASEILQRLVSADEEAVFNNALLDLFNQHKTALEDLVKLVIPTDLEKRRKLRPCWRNPKEYFLEKVQSHKRDKAKTTSHNQMVTAGQQGKNSLAIK